MANVSIVILLALICAACLKTGAMKFWQLLVAGVFGFYVAHSAIGPTIAEGLTNFFNWVGSLNF
ncbi:hypothetical protein [Streptomyces sp. CT34]|uniref:hypothetical protein n=1 Tax=Streptomyces sp. CT34 TaxID=1553907 RepID=UPI0005BBBC02|nr:hypothetical protein [Streptomyces sp. CT34]